MTGQTMQAATGQPPAMVMLTSVVPGTPPRMVNMFNPLRDGANVIDALILRRYRPPALRPWRGFDVRRTGPVARAGRAGLYAVHLSVDPLCSTGHWARLIGLADS